VSCRGPRRGRCRSATAQLRRRAGARRCEPTGCAGGCAAGSAASVAGQAESGGGSRPRGIHTYGQAAAAAGADRRRVVAGARGAHAVRCAAACAACLRCAYRWVLSTEKVLASTAEFDAADLRALLRAGPFRKFRDSLRTLAKGLSDAQAGNADSEACFKQLEALDFVLIDLAKAEDKGPGRAEATARIGAAITSLDAVLAQLPQETMSAARAALQ